MTRVKPGQRKRAFNPKTRTGCLTCKLRRLKCDEAKPQCLKCITSGRQCEGYAAIPRQQDPLSSLVKHGQPTRSLQFFLERTLEEITWVFPDQLWTDTVPTLSESEHSIRHAVLALAHFHEHFQHRRLGIVSRSDRPSHDQGLSQYNQAIGKLLSPGSGERPPADIYLISCVVFISIEFLRGNYSAAISLAHHGLKMIRDLRHPTKSRMYTTKCTPGERERLLPMIDHFFVRIEFQIFTASWMTPVITYSMLSPEDNPFTKERVTDDPDDDVYTRLCRIGLDPDQPLHFKSAVEAREAFERAWYIFLTSMNWPSRSGPRNSIVDSVKLMEFFNRFSDGVDELLETQPKDLTTRASNSLAAVDLQRRVFRASARVGRASHRSTEWDKQFPEYLIITEKAERILGVRPPSPEDSPEETGSPYLPVRIDSIAPASAVKSSLTPDPRTSISLASDASGPDMLRSQGLSPSPGPSRVDSPAPASSSYAPNLSVLPALFATLHSCRDPTIRRRIIRMLRISGRQEGFYDGLLLALVGERIIEIEEPWPDITSMAEIPVEIRLEAVWVRLADGIGQGGDGAMVEFQRTAAAGIPPPSEGGFSTMIPDDDPFAKIRFGTADPAASVTWLERVKW